MDEEVLVPLLLLLKLLPVGGRVERAQHPLVPDAVQERRRAQRVKVISGTGSVECFHRQDDV